MPWLDSLDWLSLNSLRRYPIREGSSCLSLDERFRIPDTLIVDFSLSASSDVTRRFYISQITNLLSAVSIQISDFSGTVVGVFDIQENTHTQDSNYYLNVSAAYTGASGKIVIGTLKNLLEQPAGIFTFPSSATEFEARTVVPSIEAIDRLTFTDPLLGSYSLTGDVTITTRNNLLFSKQGQTVFLDAGDGLGLNKTCFSSPCVKSVNGVLPNPVNGNISLIGLNCLKVYSEASYTLNLEDTCCTPCSGCDDLQELTSRLTSLENSFLNLRDGFNKVDNQLNMYLSTINSNCACS
jgi:hypothetical protein